MPEEETPGTNIPLYRQSGGRIRNDTWHSDGRETPSLQPRRLPNPSRPWTRSLAGPPRPRYSGIAAPAILTLPAAHRRGVDQSLKVGPGPGQDRRGTGAVLRELHWPQDAGIPRPRGTKGTRLVRRYYTRQGHLQGDCFYAGLCEPIEETERRIRETSDYIDDAERLADRHDQSPTTGKE